MGIIKHGGKFMKIVSVVSPDKVSISAFLSFMKFCLGNDYVLGEVHHLMSPEEVTAYINDLLGISEKVLFSYYCSKNVNSSDPVKIMPVRLYEISDLVVWMDLYSMDWKIIKDVPGGSGALLDRWKANLSRMS
jgi:hypothetical protein